MLEDLFAGVTTQRFESTGNVRFFGSNLRATHNLARNIAKVIKESVWQGSERLARNSPTTETAAGNTSPGF